jgi:hypothetical protein
LALCVLGTLSPGLIADLGGLDRQSRAGADSGGASAQLSLATGTRGHGLEAPSSMLAAVSSAMVTSATSTSSLLAAHGMSAVTRCQLEDFGRVSLSRLHRKVRTSASVTRLEPLFNMTGRASGRAHPMAGFAAAGGGAECSMADIGGSSG